MILWDTLNKDTQKKLRTMLPKNWRVKRPKEDIRGIHFVPVIKLQDIEQTMKRTPKGKTLE